MKLHYQDPAARQYRVFVDGKQIFDALEADDVTGEVLRRKKPARLHHTYWQTGKVRFEKIVPAEADTTLTVSPMAQKKAKEEARRKALRLSHA